MNLVCNQYDDRSPILFVDFNQTFSYIGVGTKSGYSLLSTTGEQITETFSSVGDPICIVGRLFDRSLVALVSQKDMRKLLVIHSRFNKLICDYRYSLTILAVKLNHQRLVVCVENGIFVHNLRDMQLLHSVEETPPNRNGVIALSPNDENCYLAYPGSHRVGTVYIFNALNFQNVVSIAAHDGLLAALAFNFQGNLLATASEKGTVIRVFLIPKGDKVVEFRRGLARCACICSLTFSLNNQYLVAASHTETVHVFKLESRGGTAGVGGVVGRDKAGDSSLSRTRSLSTGSSASQPGNLLPGVADDTEFPSALPDDHNPTLGDSHRHGSPAGSVGSGTGGFPPFQSTQEAASVSSWSSGLMGWVGNTLKAYTAYLPQQVSDIFAQDRAFSIAHIPDSSASEGTSVGISGPGGQQPAMGLFKVAAISYYQNQPRLIVAGLDGILHIFSIDPVNGGEAVLVRSQRLLAPSSGTSLPFPPITGCPLLAGHESSESGGRTGSDSSGRLLTGMIQQPGVYITPGSSAAGRASFAAVVGGGDGAATENATSHSPTVGQLVSSVADPEVIFDAMSPLSEEEFPSLS